MWIKPPAVTYTQIWVSHKGVTYAGWYNGEVYKTPCIELREIDAWAAMVPPAPYIEAGEGVGDIEEWAVGAVAQPYNATAPVDPLVVLKHCPGTVSSIRLALGRPAADYGKIHSALKTLVRMGKLERFAGTYKLKAT